jgi:hypothetical protein
MAQQNIDSIERAIATLSNSLLISLYIILKYIDRVR